MLHLVNRSPGESLTLCQCLERAGDGDAVLLLGNGVYAALSHPGNVRLLEASMGRVSLYALRPDLAARGILEAELLEGIALVDFTEFVELSLLHPSICSWC